MRDAGGETTVAFLASAGCQHTDPREVLPWDGSASDVVGGSSDQEKIRVGGSREFPGRAGVWLGLEEGSK